MAYGIYKKSKTIRKIVGNPRSPSNQKKLIVWDDDEKGVKKWVKKWGTKTQKKKFLK